MYEAYWNLITTPFRNTSDRKFFFYGENYEEAYLRLLYSVTQSKGLFLLTGESGCGKSFITKIFSKDMLEQGYQIAFINNPDLEPYDFLQQVVYEFGLAGQGKSKVELLRELKNFALDCSQKGKICILIVDDAHLIQNRKTWEEICLFLNMEEDGRFLLSIVLCGCPEITDTIQKLPFLKERTGIQYRIPTLTCRETGEYIYFRMEQAGCVREVFTMDAVKDIYAYSQGIPRKINNLCDLALLLGSGENATVIDRNLIRKTVEDIQGKPTTSVSK